MIEILASIISSTIIIIIILLSTIYWLGKKFAEINMRFKIIDERFKQIDKRFEQIDERFKQIDKRFEQMNRRFKELEEKTSRKIERLASAFVNYQEFFIEFLTHEGILKEGTRELLIREIHRMVKLAMMNPLTKEDWKKILEYLEKSEKNTITLEEAEEFLELARRVALEYGEHPGAWKLHIYATITLALTRKKHYAKKKSKNNS